MAGLSEFIPASSGGPVMRIDSEPSGPSWMQQALQRQQGERQQEQFDILKPALQAKAQADVAEAGSQLALIKNEQDQRTRYAVQKVQAQNELNDLLDPGINSEAEPQDFGSMTPTEQAQWKRNSALNEINDTM